MIGAPFERAFDAGIGRGSSITCHTDQYGIIRDVTIRPKPSQSNEASASQSKAAGDDQSSGDANQTSGSGAN